MRLSHLAISALLLGFTASAANAEDYTVRISLAEYQLDDPAQVAALHARIEDAAEEVCRDMILASTPYFPRAMRRCIACSTEKAIADAGLAPLTAHHVASAAPALSAREETLAQR